MLDTSDQIKLTRISNLVFFNNQLILVIWSELFFMNLLILSLLIGIMTCFLDRPLVVIWICSLGLEDLVMILWIWSTFWAFNAGKMSLILMTSKVLLADLDVCALYCFEACTYNLLELLKPLLNLLFLKYLEIWLTSFCNLAEIGGQHFIDGCWGRLIHRLIVAICQWDDSWDEFVWNFLLERITILVSS